jgi:carboxypeptidase Taq
LANDTQNFYQQLMARAKDLIVLGSATALVHWDMETMMPPKAVSLRSEQLALLSSISHKMGTDPEIGRLLQTITKSSEYERFGEVEKRNIHLIQKNYDEQTALPEKLVSETARQQAITVNIWKQVKAAKRFDLLKPELEKLLDLNRQAAEILMKVKQTRTPYDALIDIFEPKMTADAITLIFNQLQQGLKELLAKIQASPNQPDPAILKHTVPVEAQRKIAQVLSQTLGYETHTAKAGGRIDETEHPFTEGYYDDVRITTHYYPDAFASSIFSVLHETGHALYEQGLPQKWKYQPVGSPCSMGFHESQSRFWENIIGRSREFWTALLPKVKQTAAPKLDTLELDSFVRAINHVAPSKIRIEADEVTYSLHVIIRFQIEKELFNSKVTVSELPSLWNEKYAEYLGVKVQNDSEGVMQDTHWPSGLYGYFPTYALGNIYSGQITATLESDLQDWRGQVAQGSLNAIREWLATNVYSFGDLYDPADLIQKVAGRSLDAEPYLRYLREKYGGLYGF